MLLSFVAVIVGLAVLLWSADRFVEGASGTARHFGMPALLIGMVVVGFGTSAPELVVSTLAASQGNPGLAMGNAYGSNIANIALILGVTALIAPITVQSQVLRRELPILLLVTLLSAALLLSGELARFEAFTLLTVFVVLMFWSIRQGMRGAGDALGTEIEAELVAHEMPLRRAVMWLVLGLLFLILSSRLLVWAAVDIAQALGVSDLIIGLTVVAVGTSLPELASSVAAARKGEHDIAIGNVIGSNLFNTLAVVGIAGVIQPFAIEPAVLSRDVLVMAVLTVLLLIMGMGWKGRQGRINRLEGGALVTCYAAYVGYLIWGVYVG